MDIPKEIYTRAEAATYLGVKVSTLAVWSCTGRYDLPMIKVGRLARYRKADLDRWLETRSCGAETADPYQEEVMAAEPLQEADDPKAWNRKPPEKEEKEEKVEIEKPKQETPLERARKRAEAMKRGDATAIKRNGDTPPAE